MTTPKTTSGTLDIEPTPATVHTYFSREIDPILTVSSGQLVRLRTLDAGGRLGRPTPEKYEVPMIESIHGEPDGHALCGPIQVDGAHPGMTLAIDVMAVKPGDWGLTFAAADPGRQDRTIHFWSYEPDTHLWRNQHGHTVPSRPFMGVMGLPPAAPGRHASGPPRFCGGNIDCKELTAGTTLYLPVTVPGALLSLGDGHGVQGDGEISGTAIECPLDEIVVRLRLLSEVAIPAARAVTAKGWLGFGFAETLDDAAAAAIDNIVDLMTARFDLNRLDALALASLVVDLRVTQVVNGVKGVHAVLPHEALAGLGWSLPPD